MTNWHAHCLVMGRSGLPTAAKSKDRTMANENQNIFSRQDTFFGICEAVGQDFGFNPLYLRLAFVAPLFFFPVQTFAAYFGLGLIVLASRFFFPSQRAADTADAPALTEAAPAAKAEKAEELALAA